ncbi:MAG: hypothetical protein M1814_004053 [Vezdaea aestivalis]|nr:MAG: hypothetical protein M1814_004053 [Vezdaea aestivalis]
MPQPIKLSLKTNGVPLSGDSSQAGTPKLTLKFGKTGESTPTSPAVNGNRKATKRTSTPSSKVRANISAQDFPAPTSSAKKRKAAPHNDLPLPKLKKVKIIAGKKSRNPSTPLIKTKMKGKPPIRPLGVGYDSEGDDIEVDPLVEKGFILRMQPGADCDYVNEAIENRTIGKSRLDGGADVWMKFFSSNGKRGVLCVRQNLYATTLVDLPCIIETMKSWDRKAWIKTLDVCQMLLVLGPVKTEAEAKTISLPASVNPHTNAFAHGLTAPMHNVRRRRFRKRISNRTIEAVEEEVERLLDMDKDCGDEGTKYEILDLDRLARQSEALTDEDDEEDEDNEEEDTDAEPEDYFGNGVEEEHDPDDLEALLQREMLGTASAVDSPDTPDLNGLPTADSQAVSTSGADPSPAVTVSGAEEEEEEDESEEESDEDGDEDEEDEEQIAANKEREAQREEISNLEAIITEAEKSYHAAPDNNLIRSRIEKKIRSLRKDLELKKGAIGEGDD